MQDNPDSTNWEPPFHKPPPDDSLSHNSTPHPPQHNSQSYSPSPLTIRLPVMTAGPSVRRSTRHRTNSESAGLSGSEYHESDRSMEVQPQEEEELKPPVEYQTTSRGRKVMKVAYTESASEDDFGANNLFNEDQKNVKSARQHFTDDDDDDEPPIRRSTRRRTQVDDFIVSDEEDKQNGAMRYSTRSRSRKLPPKNPSTLNGGASHKPSGPSQRARRFTRRNAVREREEEDIYVQNTSSGASADADGSLDDAPHTSSDLEMEPEREPDPDPEEENDGKPYSLRQRQKINYAIPPPLEDLPKPPPKPTGGRNGGRNGYHGNGHKNRGRGLGWSASGAELGRWMGMGGDDSDSDYPTRTPRKPFGAVAPFGGAVAGAAGAGMLGDIAAGGTPSNLGKIGDAALADADPLGVNVNVTFDEVGGLDDHIHSLKEMTLLPLLYPEVFQRFSVTPPRGVLFHGPPGTGKTLLARALAASCRSNGKQISFFMRKGADCLSKWVGEAERQLRLLFEEARSCQPSIIFFDEIDGLAPVRSSKQDQIHASIVSTLLALMDGMDGRGQVIVIGATNRPDAIDPALRRPGRFDREFYFGLPGAEAREKILGIMTKGWDGWGEDAGEVGKERLKGLARLTKGYGGADLRALCTEAALNAVQRRYPQIYKSNDRLLLKPETIGVTLRDFMISIKKLVPSSARSSTSAATPLPQQFIPLLGNTLEQVKLVIERVMPVEKKLSALEEAEFEDVGGEEGALEREMLSQAMQTLRVYRPRVVLHGPVGMGQGYVGAAALHHLEGYHVQSLELGTLLGDSTRTVEAAVVQLFVEAKRHQPSVIYIPSLVGWCAAVSETSRSTVRAMLDTLNPTDPILLLAIVDGNFSELPPDVKSWFGATKDNRVALAYPSMQQREEFFDDIVKDVRRPPNHFADGVKRRKRVLEKLPIAPPLEPRQPTAVELAVQEENDQKAITLLKYRLGPILTELKRKFKRFTKRATEEYNFDPIGDPFLTVQTVTTSVEIQQVPNGVVEIVEEQHTTQQPVMNGIINGLQQAQIAEPQPQPQIPLFDMDLERMHTELYKGRYLTPQDFLDDVGKIVHNADIHAQEDLDRLYKAQAMFTAAQVSIQDLDPQFKVECERMAVRERKRRDAHKKTKEKDKGPDGLGMQNGNGVPGARRSARNNGLQPELTITDPVKLERRLKRQRGDESGGDSQHGSDTGEAGPDAKRSKVRPEDDDDHDPLDCISLAPSSQPRPHAVRFAPVVIEPMPSLTEATEEEPNEQLPGTLTPQRMDVDEPPRRSMGFPRALLNPTDTVYPSSTPSWNARPDDHQLPSFTLNVPQDDANNPFLSPPAEQEMLKPPSRIHTPRPKSKTPEPENDNQKELTPVPMIIERSPTPPLPDFHVDEELVMQLRQQLRDMTSSLTVEQLEQLRAMCLGNVWRHRTNWDRDELVRELLNVVQEFVVEVAESTADYN